MDSITGTEQFQDKKDEGLELKATKNFKTCHININGVWRIEMG